MRSTAPPARSPLARSATCGTSRTCRPAPPLTMTLTGWVEGCETPISLTVKRAVGPDFDELTDQALLAFEACGPEAAGDLPAWTPSARACGPCTSSCPRPEQLQLPDRRRRRPAARHRRPGRVVLRQRPPRQRRQGRRPDHAHLGRQRGARRRRRQQLPAADRRPSSAPGRRGRHHLQQRRLRRHPRRRSWPTTSTRRSTSRSCATARGPSSAADRQRPPDPRGRRRAARDPRPRRRSPTSASQDFAIERLCQDGEITRHRAPAAEAPTSWPGRRCRGRPRR